VSFFGIIGISLRLPTASRAVTTEAPHWQKAGGAGDPVSANGAPNENSDALPAAESQLFLSRFIAGSGLEAIAP
jgi:hypothetical protein